ncbi:unnamed protein product [Paramecium octaurelia]|uniref:Uncharacterized protein n=1 Tax=Paramecium octaurelia TaxID=43137 RepID=A0A8S1XIA5_PAROT|nr:unnamed protein product [Paramecium octaurelia]
MPEVQDKARRNNNDREESISQLFFNLVTCTFQTEFGYICLDVCVSISLHYISQEYAVSIYQNKPNSKCRLWFLIDLRIQDINTIWFWTQLIINYAYIISIGSEQNNSCKRVLQFKSLRDSCNTNSFGNFSFNFKIPSKFNYGRGLTIINI